MGGIVIDSECKTCVDGLFAAGEVTGGIHGANRVGGNAGTEVYVFGTKAGNSAVKYAKNTDFVAPFSQNSQIVYTFRQNKGKLRP